MSLFDLPSPSISRWYSSGTGSTFAHISCEEWTEGVPESRYEARNYERAEHFPLTAVNGLGECSLPAHTAGGLSTSNTSFIWRLFMMIYFASYRLCLPRDKMQICKVVKIYFYIWVLNFRMYWSSLNHTWSSTFVINKFEYICI